MAVGRPLGFSTPWSHYYFPHPLQACGEGSPFGGPDLSCRSRVSLKRAPLSFRQEWVLVVGEAEGALQIAWSFHYSYPRKGAEFEGLLGPCPSGIH